LLVSLAFAEDDRVSQRDFADFYFSSKAKEEIKAEIIADLNLSFEATKAELQDFVKSENERQRKLHAAQNEELSAVISKLKDEIEFIRELAVDANYMRNANDDAVMGLQKNIDELNNRLKALEASIKNEAPQPEIPSSGRKL
jgi:polyhydroxyalkanoate synthesis regulator phasin